MSGLPIQLNSRVFELTPVQKMEAEAARLRQALADSWAARAADLDLDLDPNRDEGERP